MIDNHGVIRDFPAASMITGLVANALGYKRNDWEKHQSLQERLVYALRWERESETMSDFQTAQLGKKDGGWTTRGIPEKRKGATYDAPHIRYRQYHADVLMFVACRLQPAGDDPTIGTIADAIAKPARPLFIGRKPCLPSSQIYAGWQNGNTALQALLCVPSDTEGKSEFRAFWQEHEKLQPDNARIMDVTDERDWKSGFHVGGRSIFTGLITVGNGGAA